MARMVSNALHSRATRQAAESSRPGGIYCSDSALWSSLYIVILCLTGGWQSDRFVRFCLVGRLGVMTMGDT
jgi:hypothetical protein